VCHSVSGPLTVCGKGVGFMDVGFWECQRACGGIYS